MVTVSPTSGDVAGNVTVSVDGGAAITMALSGGSASFNLGVLGAGNHLLAANFAAQGSLLGSSASGTLTVARAPLTITASNQNATLIAGTERFSAANALDQKITELTDELGAEEILRRAREAWELGATEVCIQAGLPPKMDGDLYIRLTRLIKEALPDIHIHGFSPEEVLYGSVRSGRTIRAYLTELRDAGVGSLPGTAAEILDDELRDRIAPGRIRTAQWIEVITTAHELGIPTTSTMMFGHAETPRHQARHLVLLRDLQRGDDIEQWARVIQHLPATIQTVYGYFNDDFAGFAPGSALMLKQKLGLRVVEPQSLWPDQDAEQARLL